jgi:mandelate racemase
MAASIEVTGLVVRPVLAPMRLPLATRVRDFTHAPFLLVDLETKGGGVGRMSGMTFHPLGLKLVPEAMHVLADALKGRAITFDDLPQVHDEGQHRLSLLGHEGVTQMALSMLDMALYDAIARASGVPLYRLLGGTNQPIPAYNSCGLGLMAAPAVARQAKQLVAEAGGYRHVKVRFGRADISDDIATLHAVREAVGPDVLLSCDFNQGLKSAQALEACRAIDGLGLTWIEEPVAYDDYPTQALLARKLATPVQVGENWWSWRVGKAAIDQGACDYVMPDLLRIGGVTGWMRLARIAEAAAIPLSSHLSPEFSAHCLAATPTRHWLEYMDWAQDLLLAPAVPQGGMLRPSEGPGAGMDWNEAAVAKVLVSA